MKRCPTQHPCPASLASGESRRGIVPRRFIACVPIPKDKPTGGPSENAASRPSFSLGPWGGARVAPQQSPILRPGHLELYHDVSKPSRIS